MEEKVEKTPDILKLEQEIKKKKEVVNISFGNEEPIKKVRKPRTKNVEPVAEPVEKKYSQEIKEEIFKELQLEEKKYTQELEEEPQEIENFLPIQKPTPLEKTQPKPQERQIPQAILPKIEKIAEVLEKQDLEGDVILLKPFEDFIKICPICNKKVKKYPVKRNGKILTQLMKCKNKKCDFKKEIVMEI
jgi:hypothetical protein